MPLKITHCNCCDNLKYTAEVKLRVLKFNLCDYCAQIVIGEMFDLMLKADAKKQQGFTLRIGELV